MLFPEKLICQQKSFLSPSFFLEDTQQKKENIAFVWLAYQPVYKRPSAFVGLGNRKLKNWVCFCFARRAKNTSIAVLGFGPVCCQKPVNTFVHSKVSNNKRKEVILLLLALFG